MQINQHWIVQLKNKHTLVEYLFVLFCSIKTWVKSEGERWKWRNKEHPSLSSWAVASAEETLEDRPTRMWAQSSGMEDVWRSSRHLLLPAPFPSDTRLNQKWLNSWCQLPHCSTGGYEEITACFLHFYLLLLRYFIANVCLNKSGSFSFRGVKQWKLYLIAKAFPDMRRVPGCVTMLKYKKADHGVPLIRGGRGAF